MLRVDLLGRSCQNAAGIDAAAQKEPERYVADQPALGRLHEKSAKFLGKDGLRLVVERGVRLDPKPPV